jgi:Flp pilus assembly pilin Flp
MAQREGEHLAFWNSFCGIPVFSRRQALLRWFHQIWREEHGQDIAEYAVMLAVILVIVVGTVRLIGGNANNVFSEVASSITQ